VNVTLTRPWTPEMKARAIRNVEWVKANMQSIVAMAAPPPESFGQKLRQAVKERVARRTESERQWRERAAKRRSRYRPPPPRKPTKGE
jgi:hypothetical protein